MPSLPEFRKWWEHIKERWDEDYLILSDEEFAMAGWMASWQTSAKEQRERWAYWIGNKLTQKHPEHRALLWAIAEAIERDNFGVVAKPQNFEVDMIDETK